MPTLRIDTMRFCEAEREDWQRNSARGSCTTLSRLPTSSFLRRILVAKARVRPQRFFGEAFVAANWSPGGGREATPGTPQHGWYSLHKWLTCAAWAGHRRPTATFAKEFKEALEKHFPQLQEVQACARELAQHIGCPPVPPDSLADPR